ncbi:MAG: glycosyltransferase [Leptolyngbya sp. SIO3F4]|nr:glycosyltransferase [Leptolyngbya sp. SIO3F4]
MNPFGFVVIGRNEGDRLIRCLKSLRSQCSEAVPIVYVDSGSTDGSVEFAKSVGADVVSLDLSKPFTMARGRNAGWKHLYHKYPEIQYIQFLDGDCELISQWIDQALQTIESNDSLAIVCGRRRERFPDASIYNLLAEMEWNTPVGEAKACGGDALIRVAALLEVDGYNPLMICGEEPEMCIRLRQCGWKIQRIAADMTKHDLAMHRFDQWWKRMTRAGWAVAEGTAMHGETEERYMVREYRSGWLWGALIPIFAIVMAWPSYGVSLLLMLAYPYLGYRIYRYRLDYGDGIRESCIYAFFCTLSKFPQLAGQTKYWWLTQLRKQPAKLIEYKTSS